VILPGRADARSPEAFSLILKEKMAARVTSADREKVCPRIGIRQRYVGSMREVKSLIDTQLAKKGRRSFDRRRAQATRWLPLIRLRCITCRVLGSNGCADPRLDHFRKLVRRIALSRIRWMRLTARAA
jgi:hypothetical protein